MSSSIGIHRWKVLVFQAFLPAITFAAGWYFAPELSIIFAPPAKSVAASANKKSSGSHFTGDLAQAKAALAKIPKLQGDGWTDNYAMLDFVAGLDADTVKGLLDNMVAKPENDHSGISELIDRWTELDPKAAFAWVQNLKIPQEKNTYIDQVLSNWAAQNPADTLAALRALPIGEQSGLLPAAQYWSTTNLYLDLFSTWANQDPIAAAASALNLPASNERNDSLNAVAKAWAEQDPTSALAWANALPAGSAKDGALSAAIGAISEQDPQAAADFATSLPDTPAVDTMLKNIAGNWAIQDPIAALTWAEQSLTGTAHDEAVDAAFKTMIRFNPAGAATYLAQNADPYLNDFIHPFDVANEWVQQDSQAALAWAQSLPATSGGSQDPNSNLREQVLWGVLSSWSANDPVDAAVYIQNLTADPNFGKLTSLVAANWASSDPQAALTWAQSLTGDAQNNSVAAVISSLAQIDPQTAWNDAEQLSGSNQDKALNSVIAAWAGQQPAQAAAALASLPTGDTLNSATASVAASWLNQDPAAASTWIDTLPQGSARDGAVDAIISNVGQNNPASAFNWAITIGDPTDRDTQVVQLTTQWSAKDPAAAATAAQNALNLSGLTPAQQTTLQKIAGKTSP